MHRNPCSMEQGYPFATMRSPHSNVDALGSEVFAIHLVFESPEGTADSGK